MHFDICISLDGLPSVPSGYLNGNIAEHSTILTQLAMNGTSSFCLPATILVLMSEHLSLNHTYSNNRCEPFKDGCVIAPNRMRLMSLGQAAWRLLIARGLDPFLRSQSRDRVLGKQF